MSALGLLTRREMRRFVRQPTRIVAAVGTPALFWILAGSGFAGSFAYPIEQSGDTTIGYGAYLVPGMATMVVLFASIFSAMSLIQDRDEGFLQSVLVSPVGRWQVAGSKVLASTMQATAQATLVLLAAPLVGIDLSLVGLAVAFVGLAMASLFLTSIGLALAWRIESQAGFHGVMNLLLMPMWLLSGALFPPEGAVPWMSWIIAVNPLAWITRCIASGLGVMDAGLGHWAGSLALGAAAFLGALLAMSGRRPAHRG